MELREFIREWLADGKDVLVMMPSQNAPSATEGVEKALRKTFAASILSLIILA